MRGPQEQVQGVRLSRRAGSLLIAWISLGFLPFLMAKFGIPFLPSIELMEKIGPLCLLAGMLSAALFPMFVVRLSLAIRGKIVRRFFAILLSPVVGYFMGKNVVFAVPMFFALIAGHQVELPFTVQGTEKKHSLRAVCRSAIVFQGLMFPLDGVSGASGDPGLGLAPGKRVVVIGWGNSLGVYADRVRPAE